MAIPVDVSDFADVDRLPRIALSAFGAIDVVCLNAGVNATHVPTWEIGLEDWDWTLKPNVWGVLNGHPCLRCRACSPWSAGARPAATS